MKHGPETIDRVYSCYYRNGKMHGREWEKKHNGNYYMCYEADWKHGLHHGWEIEYWGKGWGLNMFQYVNGKKHGLSVYYTNDEANANTPIEFGIWVNDKEVVRSELAKTL
jgi:antitoxin component YwqK of YwqJK toxin-antitoxin module